MLRRLSLHTVVIALAMAGTAQAQTAVPLGSATDFGVLGGTAVSNTGSTSVNGDLGVSPGTAVSGFPPGIVTGSIHAGDATAAQAQASLITAYNNAAAQPATATIPGELGGQTLGPGVYGSVTGAFQLNGTLTLNAQGNSAAVFILRTTTTLATAMGSQVVLANGASTCNVFWQVGSDATLGTSSTFAGNVLAFNSITAGAGATGYARLLARNGAVSLSTNNDTRAACDSTAPTLGVSGVPKRCTTRNFKVTVTADDPLRRATDLTLDGKRIKNSDGASFVARVRAAKLASGKHVLRVSSSDTAGNRATRVARFSRCPRAAATPQFTG